MAWFKKNETKVGEEISNSMGRPLNQAIKEVATMIQRSDVLCELSRDALKDEVISVDSHNLVKIKKDPIGISFIISPWNYPLLTVVNSLIASILCGNPVLLKHSVRTPIIGDFFESAFNSVGATNVVQHLFLDGPHISALYKSPNINFVGFTGSVETGKIVLKDVAAKGRFIHSAYELGGKDAAYIREDADLKFAVENVIDGALYNSGQSCCSIERAYVHESLYDKFIELAQAEIEKYTIGNPQGTEVDGNLVFPSLGPMALPDSLSILKEQVEHAGESGAEVIIGGNITTDSQGLGRFFEPTLLKNCDNNMEIVRKESFGPVLPVIKVSSDNEAIDMINDSDYGLTAAIYSKNFNLAEKLGSSIEVGTVFLNRCDTLNPRLPWSGRKESGVGVGLSKHAFAGFYRLKGYNFNLH